MSLGDTGSPFCHISIPAPDLAAAKSFYETVFGWRVQAKVPGPRYWFFQSGNVGGAFDGNGKPARNSVVLILCTDDIDAMVETIRQNGGTVTKDPSTMEEASPGRDAYFLDPNGNEMGIYSER